LEVARRQQAKSWELRAAMSLARLYRKQDKQEEAWSLLTLIYNSFTEGFDTVDLREAKALIDALS
jgi:predicted ATPase